MLNADELNQNTVKIDKIWVIARPMRQGFRKRFKDAIRVLKGEAEAVMFYKQ